MIAPNQIERPANAALAIIAVGVVIAGLYHGRALLIPIAVAIFIWSMLEAIIKGFANLPIGRYRLSRGYASLVTAAVVLGAGYFIVFILLAQVDSLGDAWPRYVLRFESILSDLTRVLGPERSEKLNAILAGVDLTKWLPQLLASTQFVVTNTLLVIAYVGFMFAESTFVESKISALSKDEQGAHGTAALLRSVFESVQRYMWIKSVISLCTALACYAVLRAVGVDFAETWALLVFVLNYIPNIGSILAVAFPAIIALVQFDTLGPFIILLGSLTAIQLTIGSIIEPMLMGNSLNISPLAIILGLAFWGTLWGIVGMFLSVPILVVILIVCAHVPSWRWVAVLLSKDGRIAE